MNKLKTIVALALAIQIAACGGRAPTPVMVSQYGDQEKSCKALEHEISTTQAEIQRLLPDRDKTGKNVALGIAGAFLLVPWFFMDFQNAEQVEYEAYRQRYNHLTTIAMTKNCSVKAEHYPSVQEMKEQYEKCKKSKLLIKNSLKNT